jgi:hypothetical protein
MRIYFIVRAMDATKGDEIGRCIAGNIRCFAQR